MNVSGYCWYLEHVTTGRRVFLRAGENTIGRHSSCSPSLPGYMFLSRHHAKLIVRNGRIVVLEQMNAVNGVFIGNRQMVGKRYPLRCGDIIGLGVYIGYQQKPEVPANYPIFRLKKI